MLTQPIHGTHDIVLPPLPPESEVLTNATPYIALQEAVLTKKILATTVLCIVAVAIQNSGRL